MATETSKEILPLRGWFDRYVETFYRGDPEHDRAIKLKQLHTHRVCREIRALARKLELDAEDCLTSETVALLHDLGRFEQLDRYGTFIDLVSVNHALLGVRIAACRKLLEHLPQFQRAVIFKAVAYHNAVELPAGQDAATRLHMRLIRDADKLDIWRVFVEYYGEKQPNSAIALSLPDKPGYSEKVLGAIQAGTYARMADLKTLNDFKLLQISWVFDLNFSESHKAVRRREYIEKIAGTLPVASDIADAVQCARDYVRHQAARQPGRWP